MKPVPFPILETNRLVLRKLTMEDVEDIFQMRSDQRMNQYTDSIVDKDQSETLAFIKSRNQGIEEGKWLLWAIAEKASNQVIGTISVWNFNDEKNSGELGFGVRPDAQNRGYMSEALSAVTDYSFNGLKLNVLEAYTEEDNAPSIQLLKKNGFAETDRITEEGYYTDKEYNMIIFKRYAN